MAQYKSYILFVRQVHAKDNAANSSDNTTKKRAVMHNDRGRWGPSIKTMLGNRESARTDGD